MTAKTLLPIQKIPVSACRNLLGLLTDIDDTMTTHGKLLSSALQGLEKAKKAGLAVVVVTGRPAGWVDHIARMWPVDGVIGENGAFYFHMKNGKLQKRFLDTEEKRKENRKKLDGITREILEKIPGTALASDQAYRACDLAIDYCEDVPPLNHQAARRIVEIFQRHGATAKISSIHVNGWFGNYDKLHMAKIFFQEVFGIDLLAQENRNVFVGDSPNDEPLFAFFTHGIGVANLKSFLSEMSQPPHWLTKKEFSAGFAEAIQEILKKRKKN